LPPYFLSYSVSDAGAVAIRAQAGALIDSSANHARIADVQLRIAIPSWTTHTALIAPRQ